MPWCRNELNSMRRGRRLCEIYGFNVKAEAHRLLLWRIATFHAGGAMNCVAGQLHLDVQMPYLTRWYS
jgi:hypothetical protein